MREFTEDQISNTFDTNEMTNKYYLFRFNEDPLQLSKPGSICQEVVKEKTDPEETTGSHCLAFVDITCRMVVMQPNTKKNALTPI